MVVIKRQVIELSSIFFLGAGIVPVNCHHKGIWCYSIGKQLLLTILFTASIDIDFVQSENVDEYLRKLFIFSKLFMFPIKVINLYMHRNEIDYINGQFYVIDMKLGIRYRQLLETSDIKSYKVFKVFYILIVITIASFMLTPFILDDRKLITDAWIPIDWKTNNYHYAIACVFQILGCLAVGNCIMITDILTSCYLLMVKGYYECIIDFFENMPSAENCDQQEKRNHRSLKNILNIHDDLLKLTSSIQDVYSIPIFMELFLTTVVLCATLFQLSQQNATTNGNIYETANLLCYLSANIFFAFIICLCGTQVIIISEKLRVFVFHSAWYQQSKRIKQKIILLNERLSRPNYVQIAHLFNLDLVTFVKMVKGAYSLYAVLSSQKD